MARQPPDESALFGATRPRAVRDRPVDRSLAPLFHGIAWFSLVIGVAFGLWLVDFQVAEPVQKAIGYPLGVALFIFLIRSTPSTRLAPDARSRRYSRRFGGLIGGMTALLLLGAFVTAFQLRTWGDWVIFAVFATLPVGVGVMLHTRFTIGSGERLRLRSGR